MKTPGSRQIGSGLGVWGERELPLRTGSEETELSRTFRRFPAHLARLSTKGARNTSALPYPPPKPELHRQLAEATKVAPRHRRVLLLVGLHPIPFFRNEEYD